MSTAPTSLNSKDLRRYLALMIGFYAAWIALYYFTAWVGSVRGPAFDPALPIDDGIPYLPELLPVYFLAYIVIPGLFLVSREARFLNRAYVTIIAANCLAFLIFAIFPSQGPERAVADHSNEFVEWLIVLTQGLDSRYNALPSLHSANPWLLFLLAARWRGWSRVTALFLVLAVAISGATVLVKQHYALDVVAGIALAGAAFWIGGRIRISDEAW